MLPFCGFLGAALVLFVLVDGFETIILPRRISRDFRLVRLVFVSTWNPWRHVAYRIRRPNRRETWLGIYGPLSMLILLTVWAVVLLLGFGLLHWAAQSVAHGPTWPGFVDSIYFSGTNFFTLGLGDLKPVTFWSRLLSVMEAGMGFAFLATVIGYMPILYQAFSSRETHITLLDARAGSPATATALLTRYQRQHGMDMQPFLATWEEWAAELLESHLSYPVLSYYRSQHQNQSWLGAMVAILDTCALLIVMEEESLYQAQLTFAMARHAMVDIAGTFRLTPDEPSDRLSREQWKLMQGEFANVGLPRPATPDLLDRLQELRETYEPYAQALADHFVLTLPQWIGDPHRPDNWQTSAHGPRVRSLFDQRSGTDVTAQGGR